MASKAKPSDTTEVDSPRRNPIVAGSWIAAAACLAFGVTTPIIQRFGRGAGPFLTAALLYAGASLASVGSLWSRPEREVPVRPANAPRLFAVAILGAVLAPACLAWGLQRIGATTAALLLNFEAVFTVLVARAFFREHVGRRVASAITIIFVGGVFSVSSIAAGSAFSTGSLAGAAAIVIATLGWALDNALTRPLADVNPAQVVLWKGLAGASLSLALSRLLAEPIPDLAGAAALLLCGATGYGLSLRLYLLAQRRIGAARTGSIFAVAPFVGAVVAWPMGDRSAGSMSAVAAGFFALGIYLHLTERHGHAHGHEATEHEHSHRHDDGHHDHTHDPPVDGEHSHPHRHEPVVHAHPHAPDLHHDHAHD